MIITNVTPADYGEVLYVLSFAIFELVTNVSKCLSSDYILSTDVWNVTYHAASFGYWFAQSFFGQGTGLGEIPHSVPAMKNFTNLINYIGNSTEVIFGNMSGQNGVSAALKEFSNRIDENISVQFAEALRFGSTAMVKLLGQISSAFR